MSKLALLALALVLTACASSPVGVTRIDPSAVHQRLTRSALSTKQLSPQTQNVLLEENLDALFDDDPEKASDPALPRAGCSLTSCSRPSRVKA